MTVDEIVNVYKYSVFDEYEIYCPITGTKKSHKLLNENSLALLNARFKYEDF